MGGRAPQRGGESIREGERVSTEVKGEREREHRKIFPKATCSL